MLEVHKRTKKILRIFLNKANWYAQPKGSSMFKRQFLKGINPLDKVTLPLEVITVRAWDVAYKEPSEQNRYPDYTASIKLHKDKDGNIYIDGGYCEDLIDDFKSGQDIIYGRFRKNVGVRDQWMLKQAIEDGIKCNVVIPKQSGAGVREWEQMRNMFLEYKFKIIGADTGNKKGGKEKRFAPFCSAAEQGAVYILLDTFPNKATLNAFLSELEKFDPEKKSTGTRKDDWVDAIGDAYTALQDMKVYNTDALASALSHNTSNTTNQTLLAQQRASHQIKSDVTGGMAKYRSELGASKGKMSNPWGRN